MFLVAGAATSLWSHPIVLPVVLSKVTQITPVRSTQDHRRLHEVIVTISRSLRYLLSFEHGGLPLCDLLYSYTIFSVKTRMKDDGSRGSWLTEVFGVTSQSLTIVFKLLTFKN